MTKELTTKSAETMGYRGDIVFSIDVSDLHKSMAWYRDVLGFELVYTLEEMGWCEMKTATQNVTIGLSQVEKVSVGNTTPTFGVRDIEQARVHLEAHKVRFQGPTQTIPDMVKLATFYDPDGNSFMLAESLPQS